MTRADEDRETGRVADAVPPPGSREAVRRRVEDPPSCFNELRDAGRLGWVEKTEGFSGWLATSYEDVVKVLSDEAFSSRINEGPPLPDGRPRPGWFFGMDAPDHTRLRKPLTGALTRRAVEGRADRITAIVDECLDRMTANGRTSADLVSELAWPVPGLVICDLLGIPLEAQEGFEAQVAIFDRRDVSPQEMDATFEDMWSDMLDLADQKSASPGDDLLSKLLGTSEGQQPLTREECASIALSLRLAGQAPAAYVLAMGMWLLLQRPDQLSLAREADEIDAVVEEILRYAPTNNLGVVRETVAPATLAGVTVLPGDVVFVSVPVANRDPGRWPDPDTFDVTRRRSSHLAFGYGIHRCVGQHLAHLQIGITLRRVLERLAGLSIVGDVEMFESPSSYGPASLQVCWQEDTV